MRRARKVKAGEGMSFSGDVKEELSYQISEARHCRIAEITAIITMCGQISISGADRFSIRIHTENISVARKFFTLLRKTFNIEAEAGVRRNRKYENRLLYLVGVSGHEDTVRILQATKLLNANLEIEETMSLVHNLVVQKECCRRAFIRGAFLASGSISDPQRSYHFEIVCVSEQKAQQLKEIMNTFGLDAKVVLRKRYYVVYIKEGDRISEILALMEANISMMNLENIRILKEMRNSVNRKVNCETANLNKTVSAAVKQIEDIKFLKEKMGFSGLSDGLEEMARLRLAYPEATLKELGAMLTPPMGKSGVNHRLRKLSAIAEELRGNKEEDLL